MARHDASYSDQPNHGAGPPALKSKDAPMNSQQAEKAAAALLTAWQSGGTIAGLPAGAEPASIDDAYDIQDALIAKLGKKTVGWKLAHSAPDAMAKAGVKMPPFGRLLEGTLLAAGDKIARAKFRVPKVEAEIAFKMARDLPKRDKPYTPEEAAAAVGSAHLAIELADSRYADPSKASVFAFVADNSASGYLVVGKTVDGWRERNFREGMARMTLDGKLLSDAAPLGFRCDPLLVLAQCASELSRRGLGLKAGDIVTTGSHVPPQAVQGSGVVEADLGPLGTISVTLTP
jgi:2-keto-4-pentenoate hydratase